MIVLLLLTLFLFVTIGLIGCFSSEGYDIPEISTEESHIRIARQSYIDGQITIKQYEDQVKEILNPTKVKYSNCYETWLLEQDYGARNAYCSDYYNHNSNIS